jgi:endonuclease YncB( thermonuclease family)
VRYRFAAGLLATCVALSSANARGQVVSGDTLLLDGKLYRLWAIDAPESEQSCADGWPAGALAKARLQALVQGGTVHCKERERDVYGQSLAVCTVSGKDLGAALVREGLAWPSRQHAEEYFGQQALAKKERLGIHSHLCTPPWLWRAERRQQASRRKAIISTLMPTASVRSCGMNDHRRLC